jgi:hypothetical protein
MEIDLEHYFSVGDGNGIGRPVGIHRYHANVLEALREQSTPLSPVLGGGNVYLMPFPLSGGPRGEDVTEILNTASKWTIARSSRA